ncbi:hypothetical protein ACJX0J_008715 [Zea mays]
MLKRKTDELIYIQNTHYMDFFAGNQIITEQDIAAAAGATPPAAGGHILSHQMREYQEVVSPNVIGGTSESKNQEVHPGLIEPVKEFVDDTNVACTYKSA